VPTFAVWGVPDSLPVTELKVAHTGRLRSVKVSAAPSGSLAVGEKVYVLPATTEPAGLPEITGRRPPPSLPGALEAVDVANIVKEIATQRTVRRLVIIPDPVSRDCAAPYNFCAIGWKLRRGNDLRP